MPIVGNGIQSDIDIVVTLQIFVACSIADEFDAIPGNAFMDERLTRLLAMGSLAGQKENPRAFDGPEDPCPHLETWQVHFAEII